MPSGSSFRLVGAVGGALRQAGLRMDVVSDRGALLSLGAGLRPRLAGIGTSRAVAFGSPTALLALAWPGALRIAARHRAAAGVGVAVSGVGAAWAVLRLVAGARHRVGASGMTVSRLERDRV